MTMELRYADWSVNTVLPESTFVFTAPEGVEKVNSFYEAAAAAGPPAHPLVGQPAPAFTLDLLGDGTVDLASHKGKNVVVLDFWATWCGPCVRAMPVLIDVTKAYADKGVVFYAVNLRESSGQVTSFLETHEFKCAVALDSDGRVGGLYQAASIPQTVIIGKDGTVERVHVGVSPNLRSELNNELQSLTSGKRLLN